MAYPKQLKLELRERLLQDIYGNAVKYVGANPLSLNPLLIPYVPNEWVDYTDFVQGLDKLLLSWSTTETPTGQVAEGQFIPKKGASDTLTFERDAKDFLKSVLIDDVSAPLNQVEVQITDISGIVYYGYVIKSTDLSWCEFNSICTFDVNIKQQDEYTQCIQRTMIADNWQGMFDNEPTMEVAAGVKKKHPRFSYCTEHRPNGTLVIEWYMLGMLGLFGIIVAAIIVVLDIIKAIVNAVISFIDFLGGSISYLPITDPTAVFDSIAQLYIEAAGCGREHPAPLIRDYISNVCDKCGIKYDATTIDIFFAPIITVQKSDRNSYDEPNPHYNACLFFPQVKRGVRRYASINLFGTSVQNTTQYYDGLNQPVWALSDMLDHLKKVYNAQWRVQADATGQPYLYFKRKDWFLDNTPLYDFSSGGVDRHKIVEGICYQPTEFVAPASMNGLYQDDPADKCGHEASRYYNGDPLSFNNTINNPLFHGILDKSSGFGAAKFRLDGSTNDYIYDAGQVVVNGASLLLFVIPQMETVMRFVRQYADFAVLLQGETVTIPKVLIWDGKNNGGYDISSNRFLNARAIRDSIFIGASETSTGTEYFLGKTAWPATLSSVTTPDPNTRYPAQVTPGPIVLPTLIAPATVPAILNWEDGKAYPPHTKVIGHTLVPAPDVAGHYTVISGTGTTISDQPAILVNYPMYFNPYYKDSMWDWFHWIDDPYALPRLHKNWTIKIPLCKEDIQKLEAQDDGYKIKLLETILLDTPYYNQGIITGIDVCYEAGSDGNNGVGQYIELKGFV